MAGDAIEKLVAAIVAARRVALYGQGRTGLFTVSGRSAPRLETCYAAGFLPMLARKALTAAQYSAALRGLASRRRAGEPERP
jgi:hypothetical protein